MSELTQLSAAALAEALAAGEVSSVEATRAHLDRIEATDGHLGAFLHVNDASLEQAERVDAQRAAGEQLAPLAGVPIAIKDVLTTKGMPSTSASKMLEGWVPPYDATSVQRLLDSGLVALGKTNMDEFAMGGSTERSAYGPTINPWGEALVPGGSGGGSAAAVAALQAPLALGSDTGGSIRQPAAFTGTVGVKPTYGGVSRYGVIAMASSLDQIGPVSRTVLDSALLHDVIGGHDPMDATSLDREWPSFAEAAREGAAAEGLSGVRLGIPQELLGEGVAAEVRARFQEVVAQLEAAGATIVEVSTPAFAYAVEAYYLIMPAEASSNLARFDAIRYGTRIERDGQTVEEVVSASRDAGLGPEVKRRIILGTHVLSAGYYDAFYGNAQKARTLVQRDFEQAFTQCDLLVSPTAPTVPFGLGEKLDDPLAMYVGDVATIPANLAGTPAMSLPMGLVDGLPTGLQLMAPMFEDARLYRHGATVEALLNETWGGPLALKNPALADLGNGEAA